MYSIHEARLNDEYLPHYGAFLEIMDTQQVQVENVVDNWVFQLGLLVKYPADSLEGRREHISKVTGMLDALHFKVHGRYPAGSEVISLQGESNFVFGLTFNEIAKQGMEAVNELVSHASAA